MTNNLADRCEAASGAGKYAIDNGAFQDITLMLGCLCYIEQGETSLALEPAAALAALKGE